MKRLESVVEDWRVSASLSIGSADAAVAQALVAFYWTVTCALLEDLGVLRQLCAERQRSIESDASKSFIGEEVLLRTVIRAIEDEEWMETRLDRLYVGLRTLPDSTKAVVFCASESVADKVFAHLRSSNLGLIRHDVGEVSDGVNEHCWREFLTNSAIRVIVCDRQAEEGINLQGGDKVVVHFDLPYNQIVSSSAWGVLTAMAPALRYSHTYCSMKTRRSKPHGSAFSTRDGAFLTSPSRACSTWLRLN